MALLDIATYRHFTHDQTTIDADVTEALIDGQDAIEESLRRIGLLESGVKTEDLYVEWGGIEPWNGRVYPGAIPITEVPDGYALQGDAVLVSTASDNIGDLPGPFYGLGYNPDNRTILTLTYTGGWTSDNLPSSLKRAIAEVAYVLTRPVNSAISDGATEVKVADVQVKYGPNGPVSAAQGAMLSAATWNRIKKYRRRFT